MKADNSKMIFPEGPLKVINVSGEKLRANREGENLPTISVLCEGVTGFYSLVEILGASSLHQVSSVNCSLRTFSEIRAE